MRMAQQRVLILRYTINNDNILNIMYVRNLDKMSWYKLVNLYIEINPDFTSQKIESLYDYSREELIFLITIHL